MLQKRGQLCLSSAPRKVSPPSLCILELVNRELKCEALLRRKLLLCYL